MNRKKIGNILTLIGVLAWVPFLSLIAMGQEPSIFPFLIVHLTGVVTGSQLRRSASPSKGKLSRRQLAGRIMIIIGVFAWAPYLYQKEILGESILITPYLTAHLTGVLGGIALMLSVPLTTLIQDKIKPTGQVVDEPDPTP